MGIFEKIPSILMRMFLAAKAGEYPQNALFFRLARLQGSMTGHAYIIRCRFDDRANYKPSGTT
jgi:hypothetical protein